MEKVPYKCSKTSQLSMLGGDWVHFLFGLKYIVCSSLPFRKEEVRIKDLNTRYAPEENRKPSPQRHKPPRSDPATRIDRGRETEITNYSDNNNRRGRRSPSPSEQRSLERSPDLPSYTTPDTSPKGPLGVPRRHMTLAEKKRLEWEKERGMIDK